MKKADKFSDILPLLISETVLKVGTVKSNNLTLTRHTPVKPWRSWNKNKVDQRDVERERDFVPVEWEKV